MSNEETASTSGTPGVLYVDDEPQSIKYFARTFGSEFRVLTASGSAEAERILVAEAARGGVGVLVTDQRMPVETGVQLLARVKEQHPTVLRLLTTAYADIDDAAAAVNRGEIHRYILKPWDIEALRADLRDALRLHRERQLEQELLQARRQTIVALASYMAHELATPLATIATAASGLDRYLPSLLEGYRRGIPPDGPSAVPPRALAALETAPTIILESANRSRSLVRSLLMNAGNGRSDGSPRERVSMAHVVEQALEAYPFGIGERERIGVEGDDFPLVAASTLLICVLHNLIKNALEAIRAAGSGEIRLTLAPGPDWNRLLVTDTGTGIAPEAMPRIFDEFFSLKGPGRGTGMGLSFCRRVMSELAGEIVCRSVLGEYTRMELSFPPIRGRLPTEEAMPEELT